MNKRGISIMRDVIRMQENKNGLTVGEAFDDFIREKKVMKLSEATIKSYKGRFKCFTSFFPADNLISEIKPATIFQFIEYLQERNPDIKTTSINANLAHMRTVLYSFMDLGYMERFHIRLLKSEKELIETYTEAELEKLLKKPDRRTCNFSEYRTWVMICYLLGTGNRLDTISNLKIQDINFDNREIALRKVKNKRAYTIPLSSTLEKTLIEYLRFRKGKPDDYLFCNQYGGKLQKDSVTTMLYRYNRSRGVSKTSIHLFRHTFAKNWILNRGDPFRLKAILGHSTMAMVNEYVNMFGKDLHKDFDDFNPLENMKGIIGEKSAIKMR